MLSDRAYNVLKIVATMILPALGALYFTLAQIWGLPKAEEVVGTIAAVNTFVGAVLGFATRSYNKSDARFDGEFEIRGDENYRLVTNQDPTEFGGKQSLSIRVINKDTALPSE